MAKWISGINIHPPLPTLQKLFTPRPPKTNRAARPPPRRSAPPKVPFPTRSPKSLSPTKPSRFRKSSLPHPPPRQTELQGHPQEKAHHLKSHSQPVPQRACPQPNPPDSAKALYPSPPKTTQLQRDRAGASIGSKHPIPTARQRDSPSSRTIPASAGPVPRSHLQEKTHHLKSHSQPVPQKLFTPHPPPRQPEPHSHPRSTKPC
jgi:hypothetical protein